MSHGKNVAILLRYIVGTCWDMVFNKGTSMSASVLIMKYFEDSVNLILFFYYSLFLLYFRAYAGIGLSLGVTLTFFFSFLSIFAMYLLSSVAISYGNSDESFYSLARKAFPNQPAVRFVVDSLVLVKAVGVGCSYLVVVGDMLPEVVGGTPQWLGESLFRSLSIIVAVVSSHFLYYFFNRFRHSVILNSFQILFVLPASLPKRIRSLRFTNYISIMYENKAAPCQYIHFLGHHFH